MNDRLDNLFSPEKLKKRWSTPKPQAKPSPAQWKARMAQASIPEELDRISGQIRSFVRGETRQAVLEKMLGQVRSDLEVLVAGRKEGPVAEADVFAVIDRIQQMEELLEAFLADQGDI